jgi:hypothetical protein
VLCVCVCVLCLSVSVRVICVLCLSVSVRVMCVVCVSHTYVNNNIGIIYMNIHMYIYIYILGVKPGGGLSILGSVFLGVKLIKIITSDKK